MFQMEEEETSGEMINRKIELLAPAGSRTAFEAALNNGADAIYLGIDKFSARRQADNFTIDELTDVVREAHLKDTKVYVAFNTIIADEELPSAMVSLAQVYNAGADSVIVQDWGVFNLVKRYFPGLGLHASTQMNTHNVAMVKFLEEQGASRITLARELAVDEIAEICRSTGVQIETFIHGALCFSYSGQCLFSSMVGNRSGNRGLCPQACRLSYKLTAVGAGEEVWPTPGNHLLSTRDLSGIRLIPELAQAGVAALKIEGRMKSPEYVATVVRIYRAAIDRYLKDPENYSVSDEEIDELKEAFSRGFTEGYFKRIRDDRLMSYERPSDRGILLGRVTYLDVYKARLGLQLRRELCVGDEIEIWVSRGGRIRTRVDTLLIGDRPVDCAPAGAKAAVVVEARRHKIHPGDRVFRVHNERLAKLASASIAGLEAPRMPIAMSAHIDVGKPVELAARTMQDASPAEARVTSDFPAEKGERRTLSEADVIAQLNRLGNTVYAVEEWDIEVGPGVMVPLGKLNELRRILIDRLDEARLARYTRPRVSVGQARDLLSKEMSPEREAKREKPMLTVDISTVEQAHAAAHAGADWLYIKPSFSRQPGADIKEISMLAGSEGVKIALASGNVLHQGELAQFLDYAKSRRGHIDALLVGNFGLLRDTDLGDAAIFTDYHLNTFNRLTSKFLRERGAARICLSPELTLEQIRAIIASVDAQFEAMIHGWLEVMTAEHCVPSAGKKSCEACAERRFYIEDVKGFKFPVEQDAMCRSHIYNSRELYLLPNMSELVAAGISSLRLLLNRYEPHVVAQFTSVYREALDLVAAGVTDIKDTLRKAERIFPGAVDTTTGHFFRAVQ